MLQPKDDDPAAVEDGTAPLMQERSTWDRTKSINRKRSSVAANFCSGNSKPFMKDIVELKVVQAIRHQRGCVIKVVQRYQFRFRGSL